MWIEVERNWNVPELKKRISGFCADIARNARLELRVDGMEEPKHDAP